MLQTVSDGAGQQANASPPRKVPRLAPPTVHRLRLPAGPLVVGVECAPRIMLLNASQDAFVARWLRCAPDGSSAAPVDVGRELLYTPVAADVSHRLRLAVTPLWDDGTPVAGNLVAVESSAVVDEFAPRAPRTLVRRGVAGAEAGAVAVPLARVMTYNVLSQRMATPELHPHCPAWALRWPFRWRALWRELLDARPCVACLQEVEEDAWRAHFEPAMRSAGYEGVLAPKRTRRGQLTHGCATMYCAERWQLVAHRACLLYTSPSPRD